MSPKLTDYRKKDRKKTIETSIGTGVGYATAEEKAAFKNVKPLVFKLINLTSLASLVARGEEVFLFKKGSEVSIQNHIGILGDVPDKIARLISKIQDQNLRLSGHISSVIQGERALSVEVTLIAG